jgi:phosphohistidine swiveling domain-containing protein
MTREAKLAHFTIDGEGFTRIARDFLLSERPAQAWRFVVDGLQGDGVTEFATKLLEGKMKLVGNESGMEPVEDNDEEHLEEVRYIYAGRVRIDKTWWRPRAVVTNYGPDDAYAASDLINKDTTSADRLFGTRSKTATHEWYRVRTAFYAREGEKVVDVDGKWVIFEPTSEPPFWWPELRSPKEAIASMEKVGRALEEEKWSQRFGSSGQNKQKAVAEAFTQAIPSMSEARAKADRAEREEQEREREKVYQAKVEEIRVQVLAQANGDMLDLKLEDGTIIPVPRAPFICWALRRTALAPLAPPWKCVSPSGMKMQMDDPFHTDWVIGAGRDLNEAYDGPLKKASEEAMFELQHEFGQYGCTVLVDGSDVIGVVGKDILVLADLHPDHLEQVLKARAVITQTGGKLAHLAQVALEKQVPMLLVPDALKRYPEGTKLTLSPSEGSVRVHSKGF